MLNSYARITGGADRHCLELAAALRTRGHQIAFLATESPANHDQPGSFIPASVTHASRDTLPPHKRVDVLLRAFWNPAASQAFRQLVRSFQPDVVHVHKIHPQLSVAPVVHAGHRTPVVQTLHDYELIAASPFDDSGSAIDTHEGRLSYRLLNTLTYPVRRVTHVRYVDRFVAVSRYLAKAYASRGISATVLPNFVSGQRSTSPPAFRARRGILFAGKLSGEKGLTDVLELARQLPEVPVSIVGDGALASVARAEAGRLSNLSFEGRLTSSQLHEKMTASRVLVMPSRWAEPGALVGLEAMSAGTPVVTYDRGGLAEYVEDAGGGRVVPPDFRLLVRACEELYTRVELWERCSRAGVMATAYNHSIDEYIVRLEAVYSQAATAGRAPPSRRNSPGSALLDIDA